MIAERNRFIYLKIIDFQWFPTYFSCCEMRTNIRMATKHKAPKMSKPITGNLDTEEETCQRSLTLKTDRSTSSKLYNFTLNIVFFFWQNYSQKWFIFLTFGGNVDKDGTAKSSKVFSCQHFAANPNFVIDVALETIQRAMCAFDKVYLQRRQLGPNWT